MRDAVGVIAGVLSRGAFGTASVLTANNRWEPGSIGEVACGCRTAIEAAEQCGTNDRHQAGGLIRQARLHRERGEEGRAEPLLERALALQEQSLGPAHPYVAITLTHLMYIYRRQGKETPATAAQTRATQILAGLAREETAV